MTMILKNHHFNQESTPRSREFLTRGKKVRVTLRSKRQEIFDIK
jgi:hypothetical protein